MATGVTQLGTLVFKIFHPQLLCVCVRMCVCVCVCVSGDGVTCEKLDSKWSEVPNGSLVSSASDRKWAGLVGLVGVASGDVRTEKYLSVVDLYIWYVCHKADKWYNSSECVWKGQLNLWLAREQCAMEGNTKRTITCALELQWCHSGYMQT